MRPSQSRGRGSWVRLALASLTLGLATTYAIAWTSAMLVDLSASRRVWGYTFADGALWGVNRTDGLGGTLVEWVYTPWVQPQGGTGEPTEDDRLVAMGALVPSRGVRMKDVPSWGRPTVAQAEAAGNRVTHEARGWPMLGVWCTLTDNPDRLDAWRRTFVPDPPPGGAGVQPSAAADGWTQFPTATSSTPRPKPEVRGAIESPIRGRASNVATGSTLLPWRPMWPGFAVNTAVFALGWATAFIGGAAVRRRLRKQRGRCPSCAYDLLGDRASGCPECGWNR